MTERQDLSFVSSGETCAAWWYQAEGPRPHPVVVMGHGLGATRELGLDAFARRFCDAGYCALVFDYRHYGGSTGQPRELLSIPRQLADFRAAIGFARSRPGVDPARVVVWGSSFAGGHVMQLASEELGLCAAVSQVPFSNGLASTLQIPPLAALQITFWAVVDLLRALVAAAPVYIRLLGKPGEVALMSAPDCQQGYSLLVPPEVEASGRWHNQVAARIGLTIPFYAPGRSLARARVPVLVAVADEDSIAPAGPTLAAAAKSSSVTLVRYPGGHFDYYTGAGFEQIITDELAFLRKHAPTSA
jgi:uncharacterized protein